MGVRIATYAQIMHFIPPTISPYPRASPPSSPLPEPDPTAPPSSAGSPQGPPRRELLPASCAMVVGEAEGRTGWETMGITTGKQPWPPGLQQALHPAAQTAEMEIGGGGGGWEQRRRGRGARRRGGGEELERESWERGDGGGEFVGRSCWGAKLEQKARAAVLRGLWGQDL